MNVCWRLPDGTVHEQQVSDVEQLLFVIRMVGGVTFDGISYRVAESALIVDADILAVAVTLEC